MRTITHTFNVYKYSELNADAQDYAKQQYLDLPWRNEDFKELVETCLKEDYPNSVLEFQYSLGYGQGDGFNISGSLNLKDVLKYESGKFSDKEIETLKEYFEYEEFAELKKNYRYGYCLADQNDYVGLLWDQLAWYDVDVDEILLSKLDKVVCEHVKSLCKEYEQMGYEYLYKIEDEEMDLVSAANDYEYLEDGSFYGGD